MKPSLVIAGLGNQGATYERTRHNAGFQAVDVLSKEWATGDWKQSGRFDALTQEARIGVAPILLVKPLLFMNRSGEVLRKVMDFYKLSPALELLVLCDDIDLPLGTVRLRKAGGSGTHNGLKSIVEQFGEEFMRLRIGLGTHPADQDLAVWVLSVPPAEERAQLEHAYAEILPMVRQLVHS